MDEHELEQALATIRDALIQVALGRLAATDSQQAFLAGVLHGLTVALGKTDLVSPDDLPRFDQ